MTAARKRKPRALSPPGKGGRRVGSDVFDTIVRTVSDGIRMAVKGRGKKRVPMREAVRAVVSGAMRASLGVGGSLIVGTKAVMMGVIRAADERGEAALLTLAQAARDVIRATTEWRGDLRSAALGLVLGAVVSARGMGVVPSRAAHVARAAAIEEAERIGFAAAEQVCAVLKEDVAPIGVPAPLTI